MSKPRMVLLALGIGIAVVGLTSLGLSTATGRPIERSLQIHLFQLTTVSIPFLMLAMGGVSARRPWQVGLLLTVALWSYYLIDAVSRSGGGPANASLGLLILASPLLISIACIASYALSPRATPTGL